MSALADTTIELCRISSVTGDEGEICDHVQQRLERLHSNRGVVARHSNSLVLRPHRRLGVPLVVLAGHLDTVPPRQDRPVGVHTGDWLEGCGASDMKSALAVMLHLVEDLEPDDLPVDVGLCFYEKEEGPFKDNYLGPLLHLEHFLGDAALVVCMEPTSNKIQMGAVGSIHATLTFTGRRAHSARPWQGENAIYKAAPLMTRLAEMKPREVAFGPLVFREVASLTMVSEGGTRNVVPDSFVVNLNYRFAPGKSLDEGCQDVRELVAGEAEIEFTDLSPSGRVCLGNPLAESLLALAPEPEPKQAWTDVARFSEIGVDAINFGPGDGAQAHQHNEGVAVSAIEASYRMMRDWLTSPIP